MRTIKGPAVFAAQFLRDEAPYNTIENIGKWFAEMGYKGIQIPTWDPRTIDLDKAADYHLKAITAGIAELEKIAADEADEDPDITTAVGDAYQNLGYLELTLRGASGAAREWFQHTAEGHVPVPQQRCRRCLHVLQEL